MLVEIQNFSQRHINGIIQTPNLQEKWKFMGFYGHPEVAKRQEAWHLLQYLARLTPLPWLCLGDFNEVVLQSEKWGGGGRPNKQLRDFQLALGNCDLSDLGYKGPKYTWSNCRDSQTFIKERLDRGVANSVWCELYSDAELIVEASTASDHAVLVMCLQGRQHGYSQNNRFWFEACW